MQGPAAAKQALLPYVKREDVFVHPTTGEPFQPNPSLSYRNLTSIERPEEVVAFSEGRPSASDTRGVAFVDGHAKRVPEAVWPELKRASEIP
jgi:prepilin-type processing-associated H-X9-DG protein